MRTTNISFVIWANDYSDKSGGSIACHTLAEILFIFSQDVYIFKGQTYPNCPVTVINEDEDIWNLLDKNKTVVVYPEIINDNPLNANHITRWFLNSPEAIAKSNKYYPEGVSFLYSNQFVNNKGENKLPILFAYNPKLSVFKNLNFLSRKGTYYMVRKGKNLFKNYNIQKDWKEMPEIQEESHDLDLLKFFNSIERFISFDDASVYSIFASLCGAESIVIPKKNISKDNWRNSSPLWKYGIAYGFNELEDVKKTSHLLRIHLEDLLIYSYKTIINFIDFWQLEIVDTKNIKLEILDIDKIDIFRGIARSHSPDLINILSKGLELKSFCNIENKIKNYRSEINKLKNQNLKLSDPLLKHISLIKLIKIFLKRLVFHSYNLKRKILKS